jgi:hypothetical protein
MEPREALPSQHRSEDYFGKVFGAMTCCQLSPFSYFCSVSALQHPEPAIVHTGRRAGDQLGVFAS